MQKALGKGRLTMASLTYPSHIYHEFFRNVHRRQDRHLLPLPTLFPLRGDIGLNWYHIVVANIIQRKRYCIRGGDRVNDARTRQTVDW